MKIYLNTGRVITPKRETKEIYEKIKKAYKYAIQDEIINTVFEFEDADSKKILLPLSSISYIQG